MVRQVVETVVYGAAYVRLLLAYRTSRAGRTYPRLGGGAAEAVLLVPGFMGPSSVMFPMELRFERAGIPAFTFDLGLYSALPFAAIKRRLVKSVQRVRQHHPRLRRLGIVAHSMGGLIAEELVADGEFDGLEIRLLALGSPFTGTWAALMGCPISFSAFEMLPFHPRYRRKNGMRRRVDVQFLSIAGTYDILVPAERCRHPDARWHRMRVDHTGLIFKKKVFEVAKNFIATGALPSPEDS